ncbi:type II secretion system protein N [Enterobacter sp.]|uniref:type II secretion system protein N n=1 Tax=Enterobacter sp. TaxID=42895 RepID=UPI00296FE893|nr:type II secretion system protein N [Enterobacter sp.]
MDTRIQQLAGAIKQQRQTVLCGLLVCLSAILIIYSVYDYAQLSRKFTPQDEPAGVSRRMAAFSLPMNMPQNTEALPKNSDNPRQLQSTPLHLIVNGVIASTLKNRSQAIITVNNKTEIYNFGDYIEDLPGVFISSIDSNSVTINNNGAPQNFILNDSPELSLSTSLSSAASETGTVYLGDLLITNLVYQQDALQGIRLNMRTDAAGSLTAGLKPGDLAIKMNSYSLTRKDSAEAAIQALASLRTAQFTVLRDGQEELVNVSTDADDNNKDK